MDPENLRWSLLIIGAVLIVAVYTFGRHQAKLRNRAAIKTYTQDELEEPYIDDDTLRQELEHLDDVLADDDSSTFKEININPAMEAEYSESEDEQSFIKENCDTSKHIVSYLLKKSDGSQILRSKAHAVLVDNGFLKSDFDYLYLDNGQEIFSVALKESKQSGETHIVAICFIMDKVIHRKNANKSYETMLKVIDHLTQDLKVKVYNQNQSLLSIDDVTLIRKKLLNIND